MAARINEVRQRAGAAERPVEAGELAAVALIEELGHEVVARYRATRDPAVMDRAVEWLRERVGADVVEETLGRFTAAYPPLTRTTPPAETATAVATDTPPHADPATVLEELLLLWLANVNPATEPLRDLVDDRPLSADTGYAELIAGLQAYFATAGDDEDGENLLTTLREPMLAVPDSLLGQLRFMRERWGGTLADQLDRLVLTADVLQEEQQGRERRFRGDGNPAAGGAVGPGGPAGTAADPWGIIGTGDDADPAVQNFTTDQDWMPRLVLLAKSTYVWLDQLSRAHGRSMTRLDEVPDEELDRVARSGFSGLWLIGLWERSRASARIKQLRGNQDAAASAYSVFDYRIADDLGGEAAYEDLRRRAAERGIRMASDMVPNHMGIDSRWVLEHPDWFLSLPESPFPAYRFEGTDLSPDSRVGIFLEDHYYDGSDAAVVFKRVDRDTGDEWYIYHGNDGTGTPWNDTAQLDHVRADVREALIATIVDVARRFPVIRFDAAMTLARRHVQRLWYPEPGTAGAIPTRAEHAMTKARFDAAMPAEFWREVVDRIAAEAPDTLLLAEAFWLMEGYFVRTLGMHRVYNSAFMHMLRDERNAEYRRAIRSTLEFDPEILKRYVNFMSNPDERTAIDQFGTGDKYFGVCTVLVTLPGLPMFAHGQLEGFREKYGMEYRRALHDETPDHALRERHERQIVPLLERRELFAEVAGFRLYDFVTDDGAVDEDVYAYSNSTSGTPTLVVFHNRDKTTRGTVRSRDAAGGPGAAVGFAEAFRAGRDDDPSATPAGGSESFIVLSDHVTRAEYLRRTDDVHERGLRLDLEPYACRVFLGVERVADDDTHRYAHLAEEIGDRSIPSVAEALRRRDGAETAPVETAGRTAVTPAAAAAETVGLPTQVGRSRAAVSRLAATSGRDEIGAEEGRRRAVIENVRPEVDAGRFPIKRTPGERVVVESDAFGDGHDVVRAVLRHRAEAERDWHEVEMSPVGNDRWQAGFHVGDLGRHVYTVVAWVDRYRTWHHDLLKRVAAGQDVTVELLTGADLVAGAATRAAEAGAGAEADELAAFAEQLRAGAPLADRTTLALEAHLVAAVERFPDRRFATTYDRELSVVIDPPVARFGAWYEMFPRSAGAAGRHGTFADVEARLPYVAGMGFDVLYLPPIHPIGTAFRKGRNNSVTAVPGDPGVPWAIGAADGGHTAVHRELGTLADFRHLVEVARDHRIAIALDIAFQASPDHPAVKEHPEWFLWRPDGTVQYAENPPKKYQDIYPFSFESEAWRSLWTELRDVFLFWIDQGVTIFRVDNPHTKPFPFWEWLIGDVKARHPETVFLAEAFTRPKLLYRLAKLGFTQSYNYFPWRTSKAELTDYLTELTQTDVREFCRPNLWPNTPDILTAYLQDGGRPAFITRFILAATLGASYGIYGPAFELMQAVPREPGSEEYLDSEKYQLRHWDLDTQDSLRDLITTVNLARRGNAALHGDWSLRFHPVDNDQLICYSKRTEDLANVVLVVVNLDPRWRQSGWVDLPLHELGLDPTEPYEVEDILAGVSYVWRGRRNYVELDPARVPAHLFRVHRRAGVVQPEWGR